MTLTKVFNEKNQAVYDSLYVSLLDGLGTLQLLIAVCENDSLRYQIIEDYEQKLSQEAQSFRVKLDPIEPSLRQSLQNLADQQQNTKDQPQFVTVLGTEQLDGDGLKKFWGYLQWTREGLRAFSCPIVLWVPQRLLKEMVRQAPDFWRWRNGVFLFTPQTIEEQKGEQIVLRELLEEQESGLFSVAQLEDSLQQAMIQWGEDSPKLETLYAQLGEAYRQQIKQGKYTTFGQQATRGEQLLLKAINLASQETESLAGNLNNLAELYYTQGKYEEAESLLLRSLAILEKQLGENHLNVAAGLNNLAELYCTQGKYEKAESLYLRSLAILEKQLGENYPQVATSLNNLASLYYSQGKYEEAEPLYLRSLAIGEKQLGENHPDVATSLNNLASLYRSQGKYEEAEPLYLRSLAIREKQLGENHPDVAQSLNNLASLYESQGKYEEAESLYQRALQICEQRLGLIHPNTMTCRDNHAKCLKQSADDLKNKSSPVSVIDH